MEEQLVSHASTFVSCDPRPISKLSTIALHNQALLDVLGIVCRLRVDKWGNTGNTGVSQKKCRLIGWDKVEISVECKFLRHNLSLGYDRTST